MFKKIIIIGCAFTFGCAPMNYRPIVYPESIKDYSKYQSDLSDCERWAERAISEDPSVANGAVGGAIGGALTSAALGAILGAVIGFDPGIGAAAGAAVGGYSGGISGAAVTYAEKKRREKEAILMCLRNRGYQVAY